MRTAKKVLSLILAITMLATCFIVTSAPAFAYTDTANHWASSSIDTLTKYEIVSGDGDGLFRPDDSITRAEFLKMVCGVSGQKAAAELNFADVDPNAWYVPTLKIAVAAGYVKGYEDGTIRPDANITREEAATVIYRAFTAKLQEASNEQLTFADSANVSDWAKGPVAALVKSGVINGYEGNVFKPQNPITRAETAKMLVSFLNVGTTSLSGAGTSYIYINDSSSSGGGSGSDNSGGLTFKDVPKNKTVTVMVDEELDLDDLGVTLNNVTLSATSEDEDIAEVEDKNNKIVITGISVGTTKVKVTAKKSGYSSKSVTLTVKVVEESYTISGKVTGFTANDKGKTVTVTVTDSKGNVVDTVTTTVDENGVAAYKATVSDKATYTVTPVANGYKMDPVTVKVDADKNTADEVKAVAKSEEEVKDDNTAVEKADEAVAEADEVLADPEVSEEDKAAVTEAKEAVEAAKTEVEAKKAALEEAIAGGDEAAIEEAKDALIAAQDALEAKANELEEIVGSISKEETPSTEAPTEDVVPTEDVTPTEDVKPTEEVVPTATVAPTDAPVPTATTAPVTVDKSALEKAVADAKAISADEYTEESFAAVTAAITTAEGVIANADATQTAVDNAKTAIEAAIEGLVKKEAAPTATPEATEAATEEPTEAPTEEVSGALGYPEISPTADPTQYKAIITVDPTKESDAAANTYKTISEGVAAAVALNPQSEADRVAVYVNPGYYEEQVVFDGAKYITLRQTPETTGAVVVAYHYCTGYCAGDVDLNGRYNAKINWSDPRTWNGYKEGDEKFTAYEVGACMTCTGDGSESVSTISYYDTDGVAHKNVAVKTAHLGSATQLSNMATLLVRGTSEYITVKDITFINSVPTMVTEREKDVLVAPEHCREIGIATSYELPRRDALAPCNYYTTEMERPDEDIFDANGAIDKQKFKKVADAYVAEGKTFSPGESLFIAQSSIGNERGHAVAYTDKADKIVFEGIRLIGNQDSLYAAGYRAYFKNCDLIGGTDYIYGQGTAVFDNCSLGLAGFSDKKYGSPIATGGHQASRKYGYLFNNCTMYNTKANNGENNLGGPWQANSQIVYYNCVIDDDASYSEKLYGKKMAPFVLDPIGYHRFGAENGLSKSYEYGTVNISGAPVDFSKRIVNKSVEEGGQGMGTVLDEWQVLEFNPRNYLAQGCDAAFTDSWDPMNFGETYLKEVDAAIASVNVTIPENEETTFDLPTAPEGLVYKWQSASTNAVVSEDGTKITVIRPAAGEANIDTKVILYVMNATTKFGDKVEIPVSITPTTNTTDVFNIPVTITTSASLNEDNDYTIVISKEGAVIKTAKVTMSKGTTEATATIENVPASAEGIDYDVKVVSTSNDVAITAPEDGVTTIKGIIGQNVNLDITGQLQIDKTVETGATYSSTEGNKVIELIALAKANGASDCITSSDVITVEYTLDVTPSTSGNSFIDLLSGEPTAAVTQNGASVQSRYILSKLGHWNQLDSINVSSGGFSGASNGPGQWLNAAGKFTAGTPSTITVTIDFKNEVISMTGKGSSKLSSYTFEGFPTDINREVLNMAMYAGTETFSISDVKLTYKEVITGAMPTPTPEPTPEVDELGRMPYEFDLSKGDRGDACDVADTRNEVYFTLMENLKSWNNAGYDAKAGNLFSVTFEGTDTYEDTVIKLDMSHPSNANGTIAIYNANDLETALATVTAGGGVSPLEFTFDAVGGETYVAKCLNDASWTIVTYVTILSSGSPKHLPETAELTYDMAKLDGIYKFEGDKTSIGYTAYQGDMVKALFTGIENIEYLTSATFSIAANQTQNDGCGGTVQFYLTSMDPTESSTNSQGEVIYPMTVEEATSTAITDVITLDIAELADWATYKDHPVTINTDAVLAAAEKGQKNLLVVFTRNEANTFIGNLGNVVLTIDKPYEEVKASGYVEYVFDATNNTSFNATTTVATITNNSETLVAVPELKMDPYALDQNKTYGFMDFSTDGYSPYTEKTEVLPLSGEEHTFTGILKPSNGIGFVLDSNLAENGSDYYNVYVMYRSREAEKNVWTKLYDYVDGADSEEYLEHTSVGQDTTVAKFENLTSEEVNIKVGGDVQGWIFCIAVEYVCEKEPVNGGAPVTVTAATLNDTAAEETVLYDENSYTVTEADGTITVAATNLKAHTNANSEKAYWVGAKFTLNADHNLAKVVFNGNEYTIDEAVDADDANAISVYVKSDAEEAQKVSFVDVDGNTYVYTFDVTGVEEYVAVKYTVSAGTLHDNAAENAIADEDLFETYTVAEADGKITVTATGLKQHENSANVKGLWVGSKVTFSKAAESGSKYYFGTEAMADEAWTGDIAEGTTDFTFYTNAADATPKTYISVLVNGVQKDYVVDVTDVKEYEEPYVLPAEINLVADFMNGAIVTTSETSPIAFGLKADGTRVAADSVSAAWKFDGFKYHSPEHGTNPGTITVAVPGPVEITFGTCAWGGTVTVKDAEGNTIASKTSNDGTCYHSNTTENVIKMYYAGEATTLTISGGSYCPYVAVKSVEAVATGTITYSIGESGATGTVPAKVDDVVGTEVTIPVNRTLYVEGKTLTGWTDGETTYAIGDKLILEEKDVVLTPVFADNAAKLGDAETSVVFDFQQKNGTPVLSIQGSTSFIVAQATIGENTIDVKMDIDTTSGKVANGSWQDWAQVNGGTKFTVPVLANSVVTVNDIYNADGTYTINSVSKTGSGQSETVAADGTCDIVVGDPSGSYWRSITVTYPAA